MPSDSEVITSKKVTQKNKGFEELARAAGLKEKTLDILAEHDFDSVDTISTDKPSTSTADVTITEDEVTSLMSAVAGISMADGTKDTMDKHSKFLVTPTCSDKSIIKVPRPFEYVDKK